jgi:TatD DNase family protein
MTIIDTHIHLDDKRYDDDLDDVIQRAESQNVKIMIIPGANPKDIPKAIQISEKYKNIYFCVGVHPYHCEEFDYEYLLSFANHPKCVAIGECGLDYFRLPEDKDEITMYKQEQKRVFKEHIKLALEIKKPLIVHIRDASQDSRDILIQEEAKKVGGVLHCYNASPILLDLDDHNFYFGIGGVVTFKNAKKLLQILPQIPLEKLLIETDGPYLTPHPYRGERNEPSYTIYIIKKISEILNINEDKLTKIFNKNSHKLFKGLNDI